MNRSIRSVRVACIAVSILGAASIASAQTTVRVTRDQAIIWRAGFTTLAAVVNSGTLLTVVGRRGEWYEVVLPSQAGGSGTTGFILTTQVELVDGTPPPSAPAARSRPEAPDAERSSSAVGVRGFGQFGYSRFAAHKSFDAIVGRAGGPFFGAGAEVRHRRGLFAAATISRFSSSGERVFVSDGQVFKLGIPVSVAMTPVTGTGGWRFVRRTATPYVGGGVGTYSFTESSKFAEESDNVKKRFIGYHALGGVEFRSNWLATAFEVQYTRVPNAIGLGGVSAEFGERDLGGIEARIKILFGR